MKKFLFLLIALIALPTWATEQADTLLDVRKPNHVLITQSDTAVSIRVKGSEADENYLFTHQIFPSGTSLVEEAGLRWDFSLPLVGGKVRKHHRSRSYSEVHALGLLMGFNHFVGSKEGVGNVVGSSFDADLKMLEMAHYWGNNLFEVSWGLGWSKYRLDGHNYFNFDGAHVTLTDYPTDAVPGRSVFRLNRHTFNFHYGRRFSTHWRFRFGPTVNIHVRPRIYNTYYKNGQPIKEMHKHNVPYNPVTVSLFGSVSWKAYGFYVKYNPINVFRKDFGPQFQSLTTGIQLFY